MIRQARALPPSSYEHKQQTKGWKKERIYDSSMVRFTITCLEEPKEEKEGRRKRKGGKRVKQQMALKRPALLLSFAVLVLYIVSIVSADHCMGGASRWWTDRTPDSYLPTDGPTSTLSLRVWVSIRQVWRVDGKNTHSRASQLDWGDQRLDYWDRPTVLGTFMLQDGVTQVEITEKNILHTYNEWGVYKVSLKERTRSTTPQNVGGGSMQGSWTIVTNEGLFYESGYIGSWSATGYDLLDALVVDYRIIGTEFRNDSSNDDNNNNGLVQKVVEIFKKANDAQAITKHIRNPIQNGNQTKQKHANLEGQQLKGRGGGGTAGWVAGPGVYHGYQFCNTLTAEEANILAKQNNHPPVDYFVVVYETSQDDGEPTFPFFLFPTCQYDWYLPGNTIGKRGIDGINNIYYNGLPFVSTHWSFPGRIDGVLWAEGEGVIDPAEVYQSGGQGSAWFDLPLQPRRDCGSEGFLYNNLVASPNTLSLGAATLNDRVTPMVLTKLTMDVSSFTIGAIVVGLSSSLSEGDFFLGVNVRLYADATPPGASTPTLGRLLYAQSLMPAFGTGRVVVPFFTSERWQFENTNTFWLGVFLSRPSWHETSVFNTVSWLESPSAPTTGSASSSLYISQPAATRTGRYYTEDSPSVTLLKEAYLTVAVLSCNSQDVIYE